MEVALLTEGVDRNDYGGTPGFWRLNVALLAEGVDRNIVAIDQFDFLECRPPRGEHTSNPLSIRLHSLSFLQAGHRFGGQQPFSMQTSGGTAFCEPAAGLFSCRLSFTGTHRADGGRCRPPG